MSSTTDDSEIGQRLAQARRATGLSQAKFTQRLGVPLRTYQNYERGERTVSKDLMIALLRTFDVDPVWILSGEGQMRRVIRPASGTADGKPVIDAELLGYALEQLQMTLMKYGVKFGLSTLGEIAALIYRDTYPIAKDDHDFRRRIESAVLELAQTFSRADLDPPASSQEVQQAVHENRGQYPEGSNENKEDS